MITNKLHIVLLCVCIVASISIKAEGVFPIPTEIPPIEMNLPNLKPISPLKLPAIDKSEVFHFDAIDDILEEKALGANSVLNTTIIEDDMADIEALKQEYVGNEKVQKAAGIFDAMVEAKLIEKLTGSELVELPIGIKKTIGNNTYTIAISRATLFPEYTQLEVYCKAELSDGRVLFFGSDDIKFTAEGGIVGDATLGLFAKFPIFKNPKKIAVVLNKFQRKQDGNHDGCYIVFDCDGFVEMRVDANLALTREWVLPCNENAQVIPGNARVEMAIGVTLTDWDDMVVDVTVPYFVLTKAPEVGFMVNMAVVDFSDLKNAPGFVLPPPVSLPPPPPGTSYVSSKAAPVNVSMIGGSNNPPASISSSGGPPSNTEPVDPNLWRGVFFKDIEIVLPQVFKNDGGDRIRVGADELYIESAGVTGKLYVLNALPYETGKIGKWRFSVDSLKCELLYNQVTRFGFDGRIGVPIADETKPFYYGANADIVHDIYNVSVGVADTTYFPLFKATDVTFYPGSKVNCTVENKEFKASATLSGLMNIAIDQNDDPDEDGESTLEIASIDFRKIIVMNEAPYLGLSNTGGSITLTMGAIMNDSPLAITSASLIKPSAETIKFSLGMEINLMDEDDGGANSSSTIGVKGKLEENAEGIQKWVYDGLSLDALFIEIAVGDQFYIAGGIETYANHPEYGNGFKGKLNGGIINSGGNGPPSWKFVIDANAMFGTKFEGTPEEFKYWLFDIYIESELFSVPLIPGALYANGFGGGACHHMKVDGFDLNAMAENPDSPSSGIHYTPTPDRKLGIKASIGLTNSPPGVPGPGTFNGLATLELSFTSNMALAEILFYGKGEFVSKTPSTVSVPDPKDHLPSVPADKDDAIALNNSQANADKYDKISVAVFIRLNFEGGFELQGSFGAYLAAGQGKIVGEGGVDLLFSPGTSKWHVWIGGYPDNSVINPHTNEVFPPVSVTINFTSDMTFTCGVYFMTGNDIPSPPGIHPQAADFLEISPNGNNRDMLTGPYDVATGAGFAFGAYAIFDFHGKDGRCWKCPFGGNRDKGFHIVGGVGFDASLLNYDYATKCSESGSHPHGAKGWRAKGSIWAFVDVKGGRAKFLGCCIGIPEMGIGLILEADVPKPSYFRAKVVIDLPIFNKISVNVPIGDKCGQVLNL